MIESDNHRKKRLKIGTILDEDVVKILKERAYREGKTISDVVQEAVISYNRTEPVKAKLRAEAAKRLCSAPFNITLDQLNQDIEEDYYDQ